MQGVGDGLGHRPRHVRRRRVPAVVRLEHELTAADGEERVDRPGVGAARDRNASSTITWTAARSTPTGRGPVGQAAVGQDTPTGWSGYSISSIHPRPASSSSCRRSHGNGDAGDVGGVRRRGRHPLCRRRRSPRRRRIQRRCRSSCRRRGRDRPSRRGRRRGRRPRAVIIPRTRRDRPRHRHGDQDDQGPPSSGHQIPLVSCNWSSVPREPTCRQPRLAADAGGAPSARSTDDGTAGRDLPVAAVRVGSIDAMPTSIGRNPGPTQRPDRSRDEHSCSPGHTTRRCEAPDRRSLRPDPERPGGRAVGARCPTSRQQPTGPTSSASVR